MLTETDIREALKVCYDPELQINIVDLGRVHAIRLEPDTDSPGQRQRVVIDLLPRNEEHDSMLVAQITNRLLGLREISRAEVDLVRNMAWKFALASSEGRHGLSKRSGLVELRSSQNGA